MYSVHLLRVSNIFCLVNFNIKLKLISLDIRSIVYGDLEVRDGCKGSWEAILKKESNKLTSEFLWKSHLLYT